MTTRPALVRALLRLYPADWRQEYGDELAGILLSRPLTAGILVDLAWNAGVQRARAAAPSTILGVAAMLIVLAGFVVDPARAALGWTALLRPTSMTFPAVVVTFLTSEVYTILLWVCGYWTLRRYGGTPARAGVAAMRMSLIAGSPVVLAGLLLGLGAIDLTFTGLASQPSALTVIVAPLARLPENWLFGWMGAWVACRFGRSKSVARAS
jgi:hypothetical protein